jgi:hypothetical protein
LFLNHGQGNHWLEITVRGKAINRSGVGCRVQVYPAGKLGSEGALLGCSEIANSQGFCTGQEPAVHFGLGSATKCDVQVVLPFGRGTIAQEDVAADQRLEIAEP